MTEGDVEVIIQRAREKYAEARARIISDNGPQFIAKDFNEFIKVMGMGHVRTSPYYPQSNGKLERDHKTIKVECIREKTQRTFLMDPAPCLQTAGTSFAGMTELFIFNYNFEN